MTQNVYDHEEFFAAYSQMDRSLHGLAGAPEWPTLLAMLPSLDGQRVLDLGCGFGWFCRWAREQGAAAVTGIDVSERMLERARVDTDDPAIQYVREDLEHAQLPRGAFDLAYSSLALHYIDDLGRLLAEVRQALVPGGALVASVEHPLLLGPRRPGWNVDDDGNTSWLVDGYLDEGIRDAPWLGRRVIKHHRTIETYARLLREAGLTLTDLREWGVTDAWLRERPDQEHERERPYFLLFRATTSELEVSA
jgi:SAM-dependent methyltransferase